MEGDTSLGKMLYNKYNFNPLPPHGGRLHILNICYESTYFNPLPPHGGRQADSKPNFDFSTFQSTPSAWRETWIIPLDRLEQRISIHSLRMEGDIPFTPKPARIITFQSTPSAWRETSWYYPIFTDSTFQSTPSAWRETFLYSVFF